MLAYELTDAGKAGNYLYLPVLKKGGSFMFHCIFDFFNVFYCYCD